MADTDARTREWREWREPVVLCREPFRPNRELIRQIVAEIEDRARQERLRARHDWRRVLAAMGTESE